MVDFGNLRAKIAANRAAPAPSKPAPKPATPAQAARPAAPRPAPRPVAQPARPAAPRPLGAVRAHAAPAAVAARPAFGGPARANAATPAPRAGSLFAGVGQANMLVDANYDRAGRYLARIDAVLLKQTRKREPFVAIEKTVVYVADDDNGQGHKLGESTTHYVAAYGKQGDYFLATIKQFISTAMGCNPDEIDQDDCDTIVGETQPLAGLVIEWQGREITLNTINAETGQPNTFTRISYKRRVSGAELASLLDDATKEAFFPNGAIDAMIAEEGGTAPAPAEVEPVAEEAPAPAEQPTVYDDGQGGMCLEDGTPCDAEGNLL